jgi:hypothetical protein
MSVEDAVDPFVGPAVRVAIFLYRWTSTSTARRSTGW